MESNILKTGRANASTFLNKMTHKPESLPFFGLIILIFFLSIFGENFFSVSTFTNILRQVSLNAIIASGMTLVILTGGIDLSVGAVLAFSGTIMAGVITSMSKGDYSIDLTLYLAWSAALIVGILCGLFSGFFISRFKLPAIIVTLAMMEAVRGLALSYTGGYPMPINRIYTYLARGTFLGLPIPAVIMLAVYIVTHIILNKLRIGRYIYAVGGNESASILSGIKTRNIHFFVYTYCGFTAAISGIIASSRVSSGQAAAGEGFELDAIAAVILGGTSIMGGRGSIVGTFIGAFILGVLNTGLNTLGIPPYPQRIIKGGIILMAILISVLRKNRQL